MSVPLIAVIYDGITNSVFESQVLQPLINEKQNKPHRPVWLISFESDVCVSIPESLVANGLYCIQYKKIPFIGLLSLRIAAYQLKKFLSRLEQYELLARGPLAGFVCLHALDKSRCTQITIQARGLLAEEYAYTHKNDTNILMRFVCAWRKKQFFMLESYVYGIAAQQSNDMQRAMKLIIQAVSPALAHYLVATYAAPTDCIRIAEHDIPPMISLEQRSRWRVALRAHMGIAHDVNVYCYNGSIKPWQFPDGVLQFFKEKYHQDATCVLVILTQDAQQFERLIHTYQLPAHAYRICTVPHVRIYEYLAACDTGILFREHTIINWTSRPTKLLEYQAVGLDVVHNNTVAYAMEKR